MKTGKKQIEKAEQTHEIRHKPCDESDSNEKLHKPCGVLEDMGIAIVKSESIQGFSPRFSMWVKGELPTQNEKKENN